MRTLFTIALALLMAVGLSACAATNGGNEVPLQAAAQQSAEKTAVDVATGRGAVADLISVAGKWNGKWSYSSKTGRLYLSLEQDGERAWGTLDSPDGRTPFFNAPVEGAIKRNTLFLKIPSIAYGYIEGTVKGDQIEGTSRGMANIATRVTFTRSK